MFCHMIKQWHRWVHSLLYCSFWYVTVLGIQQDDIENIPDFQNSVLIIQRKYNWLTIFRHKLEVVFPPGWWFWASSSHTISSVEVKHVHLWDGPHIAQTVDPKWTHVFLKFVNLQIASILVKCNISTTTIRCSSLKQSSYFSFFLFSFLHH